MIRISEAELQVMKIIWKREETTSLEIIDDLKDFKWKINTIRTLIKRLLVKGAIEISGRKGKAYTYRAIIDMDEYRLEMLRDLIKKLYNNSFQDFVVEYCAADRSAALEVVAVLKEIIQEMEKKEKMKQETEKTTLYYSSNT